MVAPVAAAVGAQAKREALKRASQAAAARLQRPSAQEKKYRITMMTAIAMLSLAVTFDVAQFLASFLNIILGLGVIIGFYLGMLAEVIFAVWFLLCGAWQGPGGKAVAVRLLITVGTVVTELVPLIQSLPALTLGILAMILVVRAEDELGTRDLKTASLADLSRIARRDIVPLARYADARYQEERTGAVEDYGITDEQLAQETSPETGRTEFQELQRQQLIQDALGRDLSGYRAAREAQIRTPGASSAASDTEEEAAA